MNKILRVNCPGCEKEFSYYESAFRPFCSERCKQIDLGHWFSESYRVPDKTATVVDENITDESSVTTEMLEDESASFDINKYSDEYE